MLTVTDLRSRAAHTEDLSRSRWVGHRPRPPSKWYMSFLWSFKRLLLFLKCGNPKISDTKFNETLTGYYPKNENILSNIYCSSLNIFILCLSGYDSRILWNFFFLAATKEHYPFGVSSSVWSQGTECLVTCVFTDATDVLVLPKFCKIVCCASFFGRLYSIVFRAFRLKLPIQTLISVAPTRSVFWCATQFQETSTPLSFLLAWTFPKPLA